MPGGFRFPEMPHHWTHPRRRPASQWLRLSLQEPASPPPTGVPTVASMPARAVFPGGSSSIDQNRLLGGVTPQEASVNSNPSGFAPVSLSIGLPARLHPVDVTELVANPGVPPGFPPMGVDSPYAQAAAAGAPSSAPAPAGEGNIAAAVAAAAAAGSPPPDISMQYYPETAQPEAVAQSGGPSAVHVAPLNAAEHRKQRRLQRKTSKNAGFYVSSPGAISTEDRDASKCQGKFDMSTLYQAQLRTDRHCMIVDFSSGRVLQSNELCDALFETMCPLPQREVADLIHEDDRLDFLDCIMYLSISKFTVLDPRGLRILTAQGTRHAALSGEQLVGTWWWLDLAPAEGGLFDAGGEGPSASASSPERWPSGEAPGLGGTLHTNAASSSLSLAPAGASPPGSEPDRGGGLHAWPGTAAEAAGASCAHGSSSF